ncbi:MAG: lipopolysaccharide biosynthesis protein [Paracoccaceae bacterium]
MRRQLIKIGGDVALVRLAGMGAGFLLTIVFARTLGAEGLGIYGYTLLLLMMASVPVSNGWGTLLLRAVSGAMANGTWRAARGIQRIATMAAVAMALMAGLAGLAWVHMWPGSWLNPAMAVTLSVILLCDQLSALRLAALRGLGHPVWGQMPETLLRPGLVLAVFLTAGWVTGTADVALALGALLVAALVAFGVGALILRRKAPAHFITAEPETAAGPWSRAAGLLATNSGLVILNGQVDFLALGLLASAADLGHYRVAMQIALVSAFGYTALNMIAAQRFAYLFAADDHVSLQATATFLARLAFVMTLPLPVLFWFWGEVILETVFGPNFVMALTPTLILLSVQSISAACGFGMTLMTMGGAEREILPITLFGVVLNGVGCLLLIPVLGLAGAALATLLSQTLWNLTVTWRLKRRFGLDATLSGLFAGPPPDNDR